MESLGRHSRWSHLQGRKWCRAACLHWPSPPEHSATNRNHTHFSLNHQCQTFVNHKGKRRVSGQVLLGAKLLTELIKVESLHFISVGCKLGLCGDFFFETAWANLSSTTRCSMRVGWQCCILSFNKWHLSVLGLECLCLKSRNSLILSHIHISPVRRVGTIVCSTIVFVRLSIYLRFTGAKSTAVHVLWDAGVKQEKINSRSGNKSQDLVFHRDHWLYLPII